RCFEDALALLDLPLQRGLRFPGFAQIAHRFSRADDLSRLRFHRRYADGGVHGTAVPGDPDGLMVLDHAAVADLVQYAVHFVPQPVRHDDIDALADRLIGAIAEQAFRRLVPAGDDAVERFGHDGI